MHNRSFSCARYQEHHLLRGIQHWKRQGYPIDRRRQNPRFAPGDPFDRFFQRRLAGEQRCRMPIVAQAQQDQDRTAATGPSRRVRQKTIAVAIRTSGRNRPACRRRSGSAARAWDRCARAPASPALPCDNCCWPRPGPRRVRRRRKSTCATSRFAFSNRAAPRAYRFAPASNHPIEPA